MGITLFDVDVIFPHYRGIDSFVADFVEYYLVLLRRVLTEEGCIVSLTTFAGKRWDS